MAKDIFYPPFIANKTECITFKSVCHKVGETFKKRLIHSVALTIMAKNNFAPLLKSFNANVLKCTAHLKTKVKFVSVTMCSLVMNLFPRDFIKAEID